MHEELKEVKKQNHAAIKALRDSNKEKNKAAGMEMGTLVFADNFDEAAARKVIGPMMERQSETRLMIMKNQHNIVKILTPEQKKKAQENLKAMADKIQTLIKK